MRQKLRRLLEIRAGTRFWPLGTIRYPIDFKWFIVKTRGTAISKTTNRFDTARRFTNTSDGLDIRRALRSASRWSCGSFVRDH
jgi:hypothetical protein